MPDPGPAQVDLDGPVPVVVVDGPDWLDLGAAGPVEDALRAVLARRPARVAVDLSGTEMADVYGVGVLVRAREVAAAQGTELVLVGAGDGVRRVLELLGLTDVLPVRERAEVMSAGRG